MTVDLTTVVIVLVAAYFWTQHENSRWLGVIGVSVLTAIFVGVPVLLFLGIVAYISGWERAIVSAILIAIVGLVTALKTARSRPAQRASEAASEAPVLPAAPRK